MKKTLIRFLAVALCGIACLADAGSIYGKTTFYGDVAMGSWASMSQSIAASPTSGGTYLGAYTNWYRVCGTNYGGRTPWSAAASISTTGFAGGSNAVSVSWTALDGVSGYVVERAFVTTNAWTNYYPVAVTSTSLVDRYTGTWVQATYGASLIADPNNGLAGVTTYTGTVDAAWSSNLVNSTATVISAWANGTFQPTNSWLSKFSATFTGQGGLVRYYLPGGGVFTNYQTPAPDRILAGLGGDIVNYSAPEGILHGVGGDVSAFSIPTGILYGDNAAGTLVGTNLNLYMLTTGNNSGLVNGAGYVPTNSAGDLDMGGHGVTNVGVLRTAIIQPNVDSTTGIVFKGQGGTNAVVIDSIGMRAGVGSIQSPDTFTVNTPLASQDSTIHLRVSTMDTILGISYAGNGSYWDSQDSGQISFKINSADAFVIGSDRSATFKSSLTINTNLTVKGYATGNFVMTPTNPAIGPSQIIDMASGRSFWNYGTMTNNATFTLTNGTQGASFSIAYIGGSTNATGMLFSNSANVAPLEWLSASIGTTSTAGKVTLFSATYRTTTNIMAGIKEQP